MSRWLAATVLALLLSCYGLAVFAQGLVGAGHAGGGTQACVTSVSLPDAAGASGTQAGDATEIAEELPSHDEAGSEHAELVDGRHPAPTPLLRSEQPLGLALASALSPLLDRPKRPPRGTALAA